MSERQERVREMIERGLTQRAVADELGVSVGTVRSDIKRLEKPTESASGQVRQVAQKVADTVKAAVSGPRVSPGRLENYEKKAAMLLAKLRDEEYPREYRVLESISTSKKSVSFLRAALAAADVQVSETEKVNRAIWAHIEAMDAEHGHRA
jgi:predicted transcriptional regulator